MGGGITQQSRLSQDFLWQSVSNPRKKPFFTSGRSILLMVPKFSIEDFIDIDFHIHHDRWWWPDFCQLIIWLVIAQLPIGKTLPPSFSLEVVLFAAGTPDHKHKGSPGFCCPQRNPRDGLFPKQLEKQHRTLLPGRKRCGSNLVGTWEVTQVAYPFPTRVVPPEKPMSTCLPFTFSQPHASGRRCSTPGNAERLRWCDGALALLVPALLKNGQFWGGWRVKQLIWVDKPHVGNSM